MHRPSPHYVQMQMVYRLPAFLAGADHDPVPLRKPILARNFSSGRQQVTQERRVFRLRRLQRGNVLAGNHQDVHRRPWIDVPERVALLILVNLSRGNASFDDFAKEAAHIGNSVQDGLYPASSGFRATTMG